MSHDIVRRSHDEELAKIGLLTLGKIFCDSGFFKDASDEPKAIVKIIAGREIGFGPMAAMSGIHVIEGKPEIGANLQAIAVRQSGRYDYRIKSKTTQICEIEFFETLGGRRESLGVEVFTIEDARRAGLADKQNWKRYPKNMLFARCMSNGVASFCPDAVGMRAYSEGEVDERDFDGKRGYRAAEDTAPAKELPKGTVTVETAPPAKPARQRAAQPKPQDAGGVPPKAATPTTTPSTPAAADQPPASTPSPKPGAVAAAMGIEPGDGPLAPDEDAQPVVNEDTGEVVGYAEKPEAPSEPKAAPSKLTVDAVSFLLGPKQERVAKQLLEIAKAETKDDAPLSCDAAALMSKNLGKKAVDEAWVNAGGSFDPSGVRLPLRGNQVAAFLTFMLEPRRS
jgi:hypothetical protein